MVFDFDFSPKFIESFKSLIFVKIGMTAYVELQEKEFADHDKGYTFSAHQQEVGTGYFDAVNNCIVGDPSTSAMDGSTEEEQF